MSVVAIPAAISALKAVIAALASPGVQWATAAYVLNVAATSPSTAAFRETLTRHGVDLRKWSEDQVEALRVKARGIMRNELSRARAAQAQFTETDASDMPFFYGATAPSQTAVVVLDAEQQAAVSGVILDMLKAAVDDIKAQRATEVAEYVRRPEHLIVDVLQWMGVAPMRPATAVEATEIDVTGQLRVIYDTLPPGRQAEFNDFMQDAGFAEQFPVVPRQPAGAGNDTVAIPVRVHVLDPPPPTATNTTVNQPAHVNHNNTTGTAGGNNNTTTVDDDDLDDNDDDDDFHDASSDDPGGPIYEEHTYDECLTDTNNCPPPNDTVHEGSGDRPYTVYGGYHEPDPGNGGGFLGNMAAWLGFGRVAHAGDIRSPAEQLRRAEAEARAPLRKTAHPMSMRRIVRLRSAPKQTIRGVPVPPPKTSRWYTAYTWALDAMRTYRTNSANLACVFRWLNGIHVPSLLSDGESADALWLLTGLALDDPRAPADGLVVPAIPWRLNRAAMSRIILLVEAVKRLHGFPAEVGRIGDSSTQFLPYVTPAARYHARSAYLFNHQVWLESVTMAKLLACSALPRRTMLAATTAIPNLETFFNEKLVIGYGVTAGGNIAKTVEESLFAKKIDLSGKMRTQACFCTAADVVAVFGPTVFQSRTAWARLFRGHSMPAALMLTVDPKKPAPPLGHEISATLCLPGGAVYRLRGVVVYKFVQPPPPPTRRYDPWPQRQPPPPQQQPYWRVDVYCADTRYADQWVLAGTYDPVRTVVDPTKITINHVDINIRRHGDNYLRDESSGKVIPIRNGQGQMTRLFEQQRMTTQQLIAQTRTSDTMRVCALTYELIYQMPNAGAPV